MNIITLKKEAQHRLKTRHLWIFSNEITGFSQSRVSGVGFSHGAGAGEIVEFRDFRGNYAGRGFLNKKSLIAGRILTFGNETVNYDFFKNRIREAIDFRGRFFPGRNSMRIVFSESDFLPGLIIDKMGDTLVIQNFCLGFEMLMPEIVSVLKELLQPAAIYQKSAGYFRALEGMSDTCRWEYGEKKMPLIIDEWGLKYNTDIVAGHKSGFYFDQSENHFFVRGLSRGKKILDCFSYTGGFALNAATGGADEVTAVEDSETAIGLAGQNAEMNKLKNIKFVCGDVFKFLENDNDKYDLIILDPPSFTKSRKNMVSALKGYSKLNELAFRRAAPGAIVLSASCSHHIKRDDFLGVISGAAAGSGRVVRLLGWRGASADHPVYVPMPETEYLKMAVLTVE